MRTEGPAPVHHHVALRRRGGAAGVARLLAGLQKGTRPVSLSFELDEPGPMEEGVGERLCDPSRLALDAADGSIVHVHATRDWRGLLAGFASSPRPLVVTVHDCSLITGGCVFPAFCPGHARDCADPCPRDFPDSFLSRARKRELVSAAKPLLVSPSSWLAAQLRREWPELAVKVVPNGVAIPVEVADKRQARARLGIAPGARASLFLAHGGARAAYKGGDRFEAILGALSGAVPGLVGLVAGGEELRRGEGVLHFPYAEGRLLSDLLAASDVLVYPSLADNHPLVILEAMASGLPVVSYRVGGIPEQIEEGAGGLLVPVLEEPALVRAAARVLTDPALARGLGAGGRERALRHFGAGRMASDYERAYARMSGRAGN